MVSSEPLASLAAPAEPGRDPGRPHAIVPALLARPGLPAARIGRERRHKLVQTDGIKLD